jgi:hypothetical protein
VAGFRLPDSASGGTALLTDPGKKAPAPPVVTAATSRPVPPPKKVSRLSA